MAAKVIVRDVSALANYAVCIQNLKAELEYCSTELISIFDNVKSNIAMLTVLTENQKDNWMDPQYDALCYKIQKCVDTMNSTAELLKGTFATISTQLDGIQQSIGYINKLVQHLRDIESSRSSIENTGVYSKHFSAAEVISKWAVAKQSVNEQIENYREALNKRGIPNGKWLNKILSEHKTAMLKQEAYELDIASGHIIADANYSDGYHYPEDYSAFYDHLADEFWKYCAESTNPNYDSSTVNKWCINCQRCVPTYEMLRRGLSVTALPCEGGYDFLSIHPFSVWENAQIVSCTGQDRNEIESAMAAWGDGARAQIVVMWTHTAGHTFVAEQRNGQTHYIDPQSGNENYIDWVDSAIPGMTQFCRIDNLSITSLADQCYTEV